MFTLNQRKISNRVSSAMLYHEAGRVLRSKGLVFEANLPGAGIGSICRVFPDPRNLDIADSALAEVIGFQEKSILIMPFEEVRGINSESLVVLEQKASVQPVSRALLGRVIDAMGNPIDGKGPIDWSLPDREERSLYQIAPNPVERKVIDRPIGVGVRAIDGLLTLGRGQRIGIMAGSGVGKSVLLGMISRFTTADVNVIALVGERGREVREFIERELGPEGLKRSVVIVATSDRSALQRVRAAHLASTIAEFFRDAGKDVLLLMDSVTRFAMALREIGLSLGEPPSSKGYTPSVFAALPKLLERAGMGTQRGSVTGIYTVLVEGDDMDEPVADATRSILDGHIVLTRALAHQNHFPAIDVLSSASRVMNSVISKEHLNSASKVKDWLAVYRKSEDLINIGAYVRGANSKIDEAVAVIDRINAFLKQPSQERSNIDESKALLNLIERSAEASSAG